MINVETRTRCAVLGTEDLEPLYRFDAFPVFMGCTLDAPSTDLCLPMDWWISRKSGLIQLRSLMPLEVLYANSHGSGCVGALWEQHHRAFAQFVSQFKPQHVIEIGGGHGLLSKAYQDYGKVDWTILEPNPSPVDGVRARYIQGFFDEKFTFEGPYDAVIHSHVFEHMYAPCQFMEHLSGFTEVGKMHIFSVPNIQRMLERKYTNGINFEHTLSLTEPYIEFLLSHYGFKICSKEYFMDDHSIFYATRREEGVVPILLSEDLYAKNKQLYEAYVAYHQALVDDLNQKVRAAHSPVYLFGAHVFAQYLIAFGLETTQLVGILDNDSHKQGKRLYGTSLRVFSPKVLGGLSAPQVILKAGIYNTEIKKDILENINPTTRFLE